MMSGFRSIVAWALCLMAMASFPSAVTTLPVDETGTSSSIAARAVPWEARHDLAFTPFRNVNNDMFSKGYRISYISSYNVGTQSRWAGIWDKPGSSAAFASMLVKAKDYQSQFNYYVSLGYRPVVVNPYPDAKGDVWFDSIWDKSTVPGGWVARHDLTASDYQTAFDTYSKQGYRLKRVSGYPSGGQARYAAIWEKSTSTIPLAARHGLTSAQYQQVTNQYVAQGFRTVHVSAYVVNNVDYYAAIWDKSTGPWVARHAMTSAGYQSEVNKWVAQGYRIKLVCGYTVSGQDRFAAIFTKE